MKRLAHRIALVTAAALLTACSTLDSELERSALLPGDANPERLIVITVHNEHATLMPRAGSTVRSYAAPARYAVSPAAQARAQSLAATYRLREVAAWPIGVLGVHCLVYELPKETDREELLERLRRDPRVESAQALQSFSTLSGKHVDPYRNLQRNLDAMNVTRAHRLSRGEGVRIGVVDTGVDLAHPDLVGRIVEYRDFVNKSSRAAPPERHGTAVAGIIGAIADNELGIVGIAPAARIYALRACWTDDSASSASCNTLTLAKALVAAIDARLDVVNLSLGGPADALLARLVRAGMQRGIVFVGAVPASRSSQTFPTDLPGVIGVDLAGKGNADATLRAPGEDVLTLVPNGSYDFVSGSSLAAASISGGIALLLAKEKNLSATKLRMLLADSHPGSAASADLNQGVDLCVALTRLLRKGSCD